ncbi:unnamed protein product [Fusarium graminearum]|uniref:Uncharacterized protein n=1 Tax=Gibberella zeae TaxID=5518 RepID=A0A4U9F432_GIBZA|nr:unnamed protein product [Fusarium graminearum]VTO89535.1 unnamed protein product [Fusarium graminearum]
MGINEFSSGSEDLNYVFVFSYAFSKTWKPHMWNVFAHELGHVLGLRHEFAIGDDMTDDENGESPKIGMTKILDYTLR